MCRFDSTKTSVGSFGSEVRFVQLKLIVIFNIYKLLPSMMLHMLPEIKKKFKKVYSGIP